MRLLSSQSCWVRVALGGSLNAPMPPRRRRGLGGRNWTRPLIVLAVAAIYLGGCSTGVSSLACPPVVAYDRPFLARAAAELEILPPGSAIEVLLADYSVLREQVRACRR